MPVFTAGRLHWYAGTVHTMDVITESPLESSLESPLALESLLESLLESRACESRA
jgi:hypothetical protein